MPAIIPEPVTLVAEPTVSDVVIATSLGSPTVSVCPVADVSISFAVPEIVSD